MGVAAGVLRRPGRRWCSGSASATSPGIFGTHANDVLSLDRYAEALSPTFFATFQNTLWIGIAGTTLCLLIGAAGRVLDGGQGARERSGILIALVLVPFWTNFLVRTIGWQVILSPQGWLSTAAAGDRVTQGPLDILYTRPAVLMGVVYNYLPLMILPLFVAFDRVGRPLREASKDLGAGRWRTFFRVTLPLARPGVIVGVLLVYIPLMGDYITATVLGGAKGNMVGQLVASQFQTAQNWALGSAMAILLILVITAVGRGRCGDRCGSISLPFRATQPPRPGRCAAAVRSAGSRERELQATREHARRRTEQPPAARASPPAAGVALAVWSISSSRSCSRRSS